jgi:sugar phosphate isomerase/epimerase
MRARLGAPTVTLRGDTTMSKERSQFTRREFGQLALAGGALSLAWPGAAFAAHTVRIGVQSYSFRTLSLDDAIKAMATIGLKECELFSGHIEPRPTMVPSPDGGRPRPPEGWRDELRIWRTTAPTVAFRDIKAKFTEAGIKLQAYNLSFNESFTDDEIEKGFEMAESLGVKLITASSTLKTLPRLLPYVAKHKIVVAMHNHSNVKDPNEFATPESIENALGQSKYFASNLDIGHFVAGGNDPIAFIQKHHDRITNLHLKDRKKDQGDNVPWGQGDTPIMEVLHLLQKNKYDIPVNIEYEYKGADAVAEVTKCFEYVKTALSQA